MNTGKMTMDYNSETKSISVNIELADGTVWFSKNQIADLFGVYISAVTMNLKSIRKEDESFLRANSQYFSYTTANGESVSRTLFNLDIIIILAFKIRGGNSHLFRQWLREQAKRPIIESRQNPIIIRIGKSNILN